MRSALRARKPRTAIHERENNQNKRRLPTDSQGLKLAGIELQHGPDAEDRLQQISPSSSTRCSGQAGHDGDETLRRDAGVTLQKPVPGRKPDAVPARPIRRQSRRRIAVPPSQDVSTMALMLRECLPPTGSGGAFDRVPDCAIFADTHWEPPGVFEHLRWLEDKLRFPVYVVDNGRSLREDVKALTNHSGSNNYVDIPVYLKGRDGVSDGIGRWQCTTNYKISPIRNKIRELLGLRKGQRVLSGTMVELWLGISTDEAVRMKDSRDRWVTNRYPLIETGMSRQDCIDWRTAPHGPWSDQLASLPSVPAAMGRDQAQVAGAVRRSGGDRREDEGRAGLRQGAIPAFVADAFSRGSSTERDGHGSGRTERRIRQRVRGAMRGVTQRRIHDRSVNTRRVW